MNPNQAATELKKIENLSALVADYEAKLEAATKLRSRVDAVKTTILCTGFWITDDGKRITKPTHDYQLSDSDFNRYTTLLDQALKANGIKPEIMAVDICPALVAESHLRGAQRLLVDATAQTLGVDTDMLLASGLDNYNKFTGLMCKLSKTLI